MADSARVVALVPAHDEERTLPAALVSLRTQTRPPDRILVVVDNCTDATAAVAAAHGVATQHTVANTDRKAGALNQALDEILPGLTDDDLVLVMDADSALVPAFLTEALTWLADHPGDGAVGGVFTGRPGGGLVGALQRNEYARYAREVARSGARATVLTGTATLFRVPTLRAVAAARGTVLPGRPGAVYDPVAITEDNEITLAVRTLGMGTSSPRACRVHTEIMTTWVDLWHQRLRWQRGALENLRAYGLTRVTSPYALKQAAMYAGILAVALFLLATALFAAIGELGPPRGFWLLVTALFVVERVVTVRRRGWRAMALARRSWSSSATTCSSRPCSCARPPSCWPAARRSGTIPSHGPRRREVYGKLGSTAVLAMPAGATALGGLGTLWYAVAACTLLAAGFALVRLLPRRER